MSEAFKDRTPIPLTNSEPWQQLKSGSGPREATSNFPELLNLITAGNTIYQGDLRLLDGHSVEDIRRELLRCFPVSTSRSHSRLFFLDNNSRLQKIVPGLGANAITFELVNSIQDDPGNRFSPAAEEYLRAHPEILVRIQNRSEQTTLQNVSKLFSVITDRFLHILGYRESNSPKPRDQYTRIDEPPSP